MICRPVSDEKPAVKSGDEDAVVGSEGQGRGPVSA